MTTVTQLTKAFGGPRLAFVEQGQPTGQPVLMLHGFTDSWRSFEPVLPHLPSGIRAIALTQRGHGDSDRPDEPYTPRTFANDAVRVLDALNIAQASIVGHCMGGQVALQIARDFPDRVQGLVLIAGFATTRDNQVVRGFWDDAVSCLTDPVDPAMVEEFQRGTVSRAVPDDFMSAIVEDSLKVPAPVWRAALRGTMDADLTPALRHITAPTMLLWGGADTIVPRCDQDHLLRGIPGSRLEVFDGTGHSPHWEEPARVAAMIEEFVHGFARS